MDGILGFWGFHHYHLHPTGALSYICATLNSLPILGLIVVYGLYLAEEKDEFQRMILVPSVLWSIGATLAVSTFSGSLEKYGQPSHLDIASVQFLFLGAMGIGFVVNSWRYN